MKTFSGYKPSVQETLKEPNTLICTLTGLIVGLWSTPQFLPQLQLLHWKLPHLPCLPLLWVPHHHLVSLLISPPSPLWWKALFPQNLTTPSNFPSHICGPDGISPRVLRTCAFQLCGVLQWIFNYSPSLTKVSVLWKTICLVPLPKKIHPTAPPEYRPVALTSHCIKPFERLFLEILYLVRSSLVPLQFAYQPQIGVDKAIVYMFQGTYTHLDKLYGEGNVFFYFSSALNTIQPILLGRKLLAMQMDALLVSSIMDYLTACRQYVHLQGAVQYCSVKYSTGSCHLQKFSDDSAVIGCIREDDITEYRRVVDEFVDWCELNY